jgi:hypothetical protein
MRLFSKIAAICAITTFATSSFADELNVFNDPLKTSRVSVAGYVGAGQAEIDVAILKLQADLETSFGAYLQFEAPLGRFFLLGARLGAHSFALNLANSDSVTVIWLGVVPKLRLPISDSAEFNISLAAGTDAVDIAWHATAGPVFYLDGFMLGLDVGVFKGAVKSALGPQWDYKMFTFSVAAYFPL